MIPVAFDYVRAGSADEAVALLIEHGDEAKLLAGGHSLLPLMKLRLAVPSVLVDIGRLTDLSYIREDGDTVAIGALTTHHAIETSAVLKEHLPLLAHATSKVGDPQVRHRGTLGGALSHGDPAADHPAILLALGGEMVIRARWRAPRDRRRLLHRLPGDGAGPRRAADRDPHPQGHRRRLVVPEVQPPGPDWATSASPPCTTAAPGIGLIDMDTKPTRATAAEQAMAGGATPADAAAVAHEGTNPPGDLNGTVESREHLARVLVRRALEEATAT